VLEAVNWAVQSGRSGPTAIDCWTCAASVEWLPGCRVLLTPDIGFSGSFRRIGCSFKLDEAGGVPTCRS
jgi:hypothetical protein